MQRISNQKIRDYFVGWQCRIRQVSAREYEGQPLAAMRPRISSVKGEVLLPAMAVLLMPHEPLESTAFFRFQIQKNFEHQRAREAAIKYLGGDFYQEPELFSDELTAVFGSGSDTAATLLKRKEVVLDFEQFSQSFRMFCKVQRLKGAEPAHQASLWQSRIFNPNIPNEAEVLAFKPDWKTAQAEPLVP